MYKQVEEEFKHQNSETLKNKITKTGGEKIELPKCPFSSSWRPYQVGEQYVRETRHLFLFYKCEELIDKKGNLETGNI